jgi:hypothetical protein
MVNQHESPFYEEDAVACQRAHRRIVESFPISRVYQAHIATYPSGHWLFGFASKKYHPIRDHDAKRWKALDLKTRYYTRIFTWGRLPCLPMLRRCCAMLNKNIETFLGCDADYNEAAVVLIGAPFDSTTSNRPGARFASRVCAVNRKGWKPSAPIRIWT